MHIVIEISDFTITDLKRKLNRTAVDNAVLQGTPLPKGYGRLIDADALAHKAEHCIETTDAFIKLIQDAKTIVEAEPMEDLEDDWEG